MSDHHRTVPANRSLLARLTGRIAPLMVFTILAGTLLWGHRTGWRAPKFSELSQRPVETKDDWCNDHQVPLSICVECNPNLLPRGKSFGWCKTHGVHDCPTCHPEVAQVDKKPVLSSSELDRARMALELMDRPENASRCKTHLRRIQFASKEAVEKAGIEVEPVWTGPVSESIGCSGEIVYDQTRTARLASRAPGQMFRAFKQVGDRVRQGEIVGLIEAAEVGRVKSEFLQAIVQMRLKSRVAEGIKSSGVAASNRSLIEAEAALTEARIRIMTTSQSMTNLGIPIDPKSFDNVAEEDLPGKLQFHGLPPSVIQGLDAKITTGNLLPLVAPLDGVVVSRDVVAGEVIDTTKVLFVVVDSTRLWVNLDVRMEDLNWIAVGQTLRFRPDGSKNDVNGTIDWISGEADHKTRTIRARAVLNSSDGRLRSNMFGTGKIVLREEKNAVIVPDSAVHWEGCCHIVFVRNKEFLQKDSPKLFLVRSVRIGTKTGTHTEIIAGLLPGEIVAAKGSAALRAELLKSNLGEGCDCCAK